MAVALLHPDLTDSIMPSKGITLSTTLTPVLSGSLGDDHQNPLIYHSRTVDRGESLLLCSVGRQIMK